ncbi:MAG: cadherin repeat domain-containing protein [Burkholderiales bacterium]|nr:cadherin repeat domain-containing protein [Burkholderiales bacterium]
MKRFLFSAMSGVLALGMAASVLAEVVVYPGGGVTLKTVTCAAAINDALTTSITTADASGRDKSTAVTGNTVTLNAGAATNPRQVLGAVNCQDADPVENNHVFINGDTDTAGGGGVIGGFADSWISNASAIGNTVTIMGGTIGSVAGGKALSSLAVGGVAEASNNTVSIGAGLPASTFDPLAWLQGGVAGVSTGNTLQLASAGLGVNGLDSFQNFEFTLPASMVSGDTMLTVAAGVFWWGEANIGTNSTVSVSAAPGLTVNPGDEFVLIDCDPCTNGFTGTVAAASQNGTFNTSNGDYSYTLSTTGSNLLMTIDALLPPTAPTITSGNSATFTANAGGTFSVITTGTAPITYSLTGAPAGVSIDSATGVITIAATVAADIYTFTITTSNGTLPNASQTFTLTVLAAATSVPAMNGGTLTALVLLLAGLTFVTLRSRLG